MRKRRADLIIPVSQLSEPTNPPPDSGGTEICGDGVCEGKETCQTCPEDCGSCNSTNPAISNSTLIYDTIENSFRRAPDSRTRRIGHFYGYSQTSGINCILSISGYGGDGLLSTPFIYSCEKFDLSTETWAYVSNIITPRAFGMSTTIGERIYCIGGIEYNDILNKYEASEKIESYNISTDTWEPLLDMPIPVAYGTSYCVGNSIYVLCGFTSIDGTRPVDLNEKILKYSIADNSWEEITPSSTELYRRISPFSFYRNSTLYVYGGSIPKSPEEISLETKAKIQTAIEEFYASLDSSNFANVLDITGQNNYIDETIQEIETSTTVPAYVYPMNGFTVNLGSESGMILDVESVESEFLSMPVPRDEGGCVYNSLSDIAYFIGGSNQNSSTTLNLIDAIDFSNNEYSTVTRLQQGRSKFASVLVDSDIYLFGGMTSGHAPGFLYLNVLQTPKYIQSNGRETNGFVVYLTDDAGEVVAEDVSLSVAGRVQIQAVDSVISAYLTTSLTDKIINSLPSISDDALAELTNEEITSLIETAQNKVLDFNSDEYQINSVKKLSDSLILFPLLYDNIYLESHDGIGSLYLKPRSEDPLSDFQKLSQFISSLTNKTIPSEDTVFGSITLEQLLAVGEALSVIKVPPVVIESSSARILYSVETTLTVDDDYYYGATVSSFFERVNSSVRSSVEQDIKQKRDDARERLGLDEIEETITSPQSLAKENGQSLSSTSKLPLAVSIKEQSLSPISFYYSSQNWIPQVEQNVVTNISSALPVIEEIGDYPPFGSSQLYDALKKMSDTMSDEELDDVKKVIYIVSDNSENISITSQSNAVDAVNAIDGRGKTPIIYTIVSTSKPSTVASQLEKTDRLSVESITKPTRGQSIALTSSEFTDQMVNFSLNNATGGLGYGSYSRSILFDVKTYVDSIETEFELPANTNGYFRFRYSYNGYSYGTWSDRYTGSKEVNLGQSIMSLEIEVTLTTGFTSGITEEYDSQSTALPYLKSITLAVSETKTDYVLLNSNSLDFNVQQLAAAVECQKPEGASVKIGVATYDSPDWRDFERTSQPAIEENGKIVVLDRSMNENSIVKNEPLTTIDGILWETRNGRWDPSSDIILYQDVDGVMTEIISGYKAYPRHGEIYFNSKQKIDSKFSLSITNKSYLKVGIKVENNNYTDSVKLTGVGYFYNTNNDSSNSFGQVPPIASSLTITPDSPSSSDTIMGLYQYRDLNNNAESGSEIKWYRNSYEVYELRGKTSWNNSNVLSANKLQPGDRITFSVKPSDGESFGDKVFSNAVIIKSSAPSVNSVRIYSKKNNATVSTFDSESTFVLAYSYVTDDTGPNSLEYNSEISWLVNGVSVKTGTYSHGDPVDSPTLVLLPSESNLGIASHPIGALISVEITPKTKLGASGAKYTSGEFTVRNTVPNIPEVIKIEPNQPQSSSSSLSLTPFTVVDIDIDIQVQTDQTEIKWYMSTNGVNFSESTVNRGKKTIPNASMASGQYWYAIVTPYDGFDRGIPVRTQTVFVR